MTISENTMIMETENLIDDSRVMDVRPIPCSIKHGLILKTWRELALNSHFILLNDHDPVPLRYQFTAEFPGAFTWEYLEKGPQDFRVKITKVQEIPAESLSAGHADAGCSARH
jgi:uncharacterized protein (DUF2249 family)